MPYQKLQASRAAVVVQSDTADIPYIGGGTGQWPCVLYVGGAGDVKVTTAGGDDVVFEAVNAGTFLPVQVIKVWSTGTSVTAAIIALW